MQVLLSGMCYIKCTFPSPGQMSVWAIHSLLYIIFKDTDWGSGPNNGPKFELIYQPNESAYETDSLPESHGAPVVIESCFND